MFCEQRLMVRPQHWGWSGTVFIFFFSWRKPENPQFQLHTVSLAVHITK